MAKKLISIRMSEQVKTLLDEICKNREATQAAIIEEAIRQMAKSEGIK